MANLTTAIVVSSYNLLQIKQMFSEKSMNPNECIFTFEENDSVKKEDELYDIIINIFKDLLPPREISQEIVSYVGVIDATIKVFNPFSCPFLTLWGWHLAQFEILKPSF